MSALDGKSMMINSMMRLLGIDPETVGKDLALAPQIIAGFKVQLDRIEANQRTLDEKLSALLACQSGTGHSVIGNGHDHVKAIDRN